jgi:hypothetical protein
MEIGLQMFVHPQNNVMRVSPVMRNRHCEMRRRLIGHLQKINKPMLLILRQRRAIDQPSAEIVGT